MTPIDDYDYAPGTVRLLDPDSLEVVSATKEAVVLIPTPSADRNDPVNWTFARKTISLMLLMSYVVARIVLELIHQIHCHDVSSWWYVRGTSVPDKQVHCMPFTHLWLSRLA
jgi:hypothetical protein